MYYMYWLLALQRALDLGIYSVSGGNMGVYRIIDMSSIL